ncbi:MAG: excinuclease ABC subunit UvrC [Firmicutes bacterium]|uniref:UvrABC system protein C n=1 Tax=Candidatus Scybalomonas excrementavium TaxID=2840943 RepID=A0A9D9N8A8_9FIRM|nr:excinuclease ABC subunit UvrC [Candidatus Scybalomonas excrementavium]
MFQIEEELKKLPAKPGVYLMHNKEGEIIYVGKAISLKNRVRQYFQSSRDKTPKIQKMVSQIAYFEYIITDSELEALVLECNLIKEHRPKYNTMLKDDKTYPYIKVTVQEPYPRILFTRQIKRDKAKYFGPYTGAVAVKDMIELIRKVYKLRSCNRSLPKENGERPCLYYHIKQCDAPCQTYISQEEYRKNVEGALRFLNGNRQELIDQLTSSMMEASQKMEFEKAGEMRDLIKSIHALDQAQKVNTSTFENRDVIAIAKAMDEAVVSVFFIRDGKLIGRENFHMTGVSYTTKSELMGNFVKQFYAGTPYIPKELVLQDAMEDEEIVGEWLSKKLGQKVTILVPQKGSKKRLVDLAYENASIVLQKDGEKLKREQMRTIGAVKELEQMLGLSGIHRMESFDISNISGFETVASMVVYEDGKPKRSDYRKFKIQTVKGQDDYKSMEEVLRRRFSHGLKEQKEMEEKGIDKQYGSFNRFPDLICMDGGKGQVNIALKVLEELKIVIPVCGLVKDDKHRTRGLYYQNQEVAFKKNSEAFHLITRIQDETHRFAIEYHKQLRSKTQVKSILDDIKGVGPARRKALMRHFKDIAFIKEAEIEQLMAVEGITENVAKEIYQFFHETKIFTSEQKYLLESK